MAASLSADMDNTNKVVLFINECKAMGIDILPPDINESTREFKVDGNSIRFGLEAVKGVGSSAIDAIIEARGSTVFESFFAFCSNMDSRRVNKKVLESLIKAGAMDSMGNRAQLWAALPTVMDAAMRFQREKNIGQESMFEIHEPTPQQMPDVNEWEDSHRLLMEKEALGFYITGHPLNEYKDKFAELSVISTPDLQDIEDKKEVLIGGLVRDSKKIQTKKGDLMGYLTVEDLYGTTEVVSFPETFSEAQEIITRDLPVIIAGYTDKTDKGLKIIARRIVSIDNDDALKNINNIDPLPVRNKWPRAARSDNPPKPQEPEFKSLVLTMYNNTEPATLPKLEEIFSRYTGDCPVYLKIVSPKNWETILSTNRQVMPSKEMIIETENLLGKGAARLN
jgi:DNA polymerase-3 subunit alpha